MTTALAFSALVWLLSFAVALYYLVRLQEWRVGMVAAVVAVVALAELATLTGREAAQTTIVGASSAELTAVVISLVTLFAVFAYANALRKARLSAAMVQGSISAERESPRSPAEIPPIEDTHAQGVTSEEKFAAAFRLNPDGIVIRRTSDGMFLEANDRCLTLLGCTLEELRLHTVDDFWEDPALRQEFVNLLAENRTVEDFEFGIVDVHAKLHTALLSCCFIDFGGEEAVLSIIHEITGQKRAEESLRQSEEQFSKAFHLNPNSMAITSVSDGRILEVNDKTLSLLGYSREEYIGRPATDIWEYPNERVKFLQQLRDTGSVEDLEINFVDKDGNRHIGLLNGCFMEFDGEQAVLSNTQDITRRKQAEEALRQSEKKFAAAFRTSPNTTVISRLSDGKILDANERCREILGYGPEELRSMKPTDFWAEPAQRVDLLRQLLETAIVEDFEFTFVGRGGVHRGGVLSACLMEFGGTQAVLTTARDVTDQKTAEELLLQSNEKFSKAFLMSPDSLVIVRASDGVTLEINDRFLQLTGYTRDEVVGIPSDNLDSWVRPEDLETLMRDLEENGERDNLQTIFRTKSGAHITVLVSARYIDIDGERCSLSIVRDVTESRRAERELAQNREMLQALLDAVPLGINVKNRTRRYTFMNPFQAKVYGTVPEDAIGKTPSELVSAEYGLSVEEHDRRVFETGKALAYFEEDTTNAQGETRDWLTTKLLLGEKDGPDAQVLSISLDMTDRKATEDQLRHAQKMEAVGHLTGGIAHDFNNLLTALLGSLQLLSDRTKDDDLAKRYIDICLRAVNRGADLTQRLLAFSRKQALNPRSTDINALIGDMTELLQRTLGAPVEIGTTPAQGLWRAMVDEAQLESAILNLAINARDAMPAGGGLTIETSNAELDGQTVDDEEVAPGSYVRISVSDSGAGIPSQVLGKVFEPFFTTKEIGKGSGLGLSMVYGFVKQSGGHVEIESEVGSGTTVRLYLPRAEAVSDVARDATEGERKLSGNESILIVEDDPDVRAFDVVILERLGYTVRSANDGLAALSMASAMPDLDLLLTDVLLPGGLSGKAIADKVIKRSPGTKVLYVSGFSEPVGTSESTSGNAAELLPKPYSRDDLARKVREVLDSDSRLPATGPGRGPNERTRLD